jgi:D-alanine-D-alanine ligase
MLQKRVTVLRGGPSAEYDVSMKTGANVLESLRRLGYNPLDVIITKDCKWLASGRLRQPEHILSTTDVVFIALHGTYGEDGTVQRLCESHHIPFTGSNSFQSRVAFNKDATKRLLQDTSILLPRHARIATEDIPMLDYIVAALDKTCGPEFVVKPVMSGSSDGVKIITKYEDLKPAIESVLATHHSCMVEERIKGVEATCGILESFRDDDYYALPPVEIIPPPEREFFDYEVKYNGQTEEICPARFSIEVREKIAEVARTVHTTLHLSQYSRTDVIVRGDDVYFLEVNTLPGLTSESLLPKEAFAIGLPYDALIQHLVSTARVR